MSDHVTDDLTAPFRFEYDPAILRYGPNCVDGLAEELAAIDCERALVVTGSTVGETQAVMTPVRDGLGDRLAGVFAETTPAKRLGTAYDALERFREVEADAVVSVGGGSSLDVAKVLAAIAATNRDPEAVGSEFAETGTIRVPDTGLPPIVAVPTTLAGADLSMVAGVTAVPGTCPVEDAASGGISAPELMPAAVCYDPELLATTPRGVLAASAMNGFDKGVETLYASTATPVTDATAMRGLGLLQDGLLAFGEGNEDDAVYQRLAQGIVLVQYGISRPGVTTLSLIHAFGHGLTRTYDVQQGAAHAVIAPHALEYLFDAVDGRQDLLADALGVADADDPASAVVESVSEVAATLGLPTRLRDVDGPAREAFPEVAEAVLSDAFMANAPAGLDPSHEDIEHVLDAAW
ncbi:iron-containing alcohol dehydrogenase family protein [Haloarcula pellucida]|uniref:Alcohol dehydrogenase n=1 Tax=Haloarcula pellucida TaxID=1427151 RepID=A0A830GNY2_9EURY|nr:iron-containing alcohol dehydrogenase family protein [Halomicroarcula pellucida]MBX0347885.1 iron-containing alcohol dehydrogenase [Halomicroarcula pellucida]GGN95901.1 alcohol dehydrogenase [Halomicroarcula pellucida]